MSALLSFLGGSAFRMVWGEVSAFVTKRQDHKYEIERADKQAGYDAAAHARNMESLQLQNTLGVKLIEAQREAHVSDANDDAWLESIRGLNSKTGIAIIDAWNQSIRPGLATLASLGLVFEAIALGHMTPFHYEIAAAVLGMYVADRSLGKRGK